MTREQQIWYGRQFGAVTELDAIIECEYRLALGWLHDECVQVKRQNGWL